MSWTAHSETPFINAQKAIIDPSGWAEQFRDGQKLRQEYETRQQQKALNEIMKVGDHNGRLELAQQHKYAGALVPQLQKYEEDRQKAALDNLKTSSEIGKIYGETGKLGAETGEIGVKTQGQNLKNIGEGNTIFANSTAGLDRTAANLTIGQLYNAGFYTASQTEMLLQKANSGKPEDIEFLKSIARTNPELAKLFQPEAKVLDGKDAAYMYTVDGFTGEAGEPTQRVAYGQSPDNFATNATSRANNQYTVDAGERNSERSLQGSMYSSDNSLKGSMYGADSRAETADQQTAVSWYNAQNKAKNDAANAESNRIKANKTGAVAGGVDANGKPIARKLESNERTKLFELQEQIDADIGVGNSLKRLNELSDVSYSGLGASFRGTAMSRLPGGASNKAANAAVLSENITIELALKQLKSTFGAAPTEGERKILMDLQASVDKSPIQKKQIIAAATNAVAERIRYRKKQQEAIRTGSYAMPKGNSSSSSSSSNKPAKTQNNKAASIIEAAMRGK